MVYAGTQTVGSCDGTMHVVSTVDYNTTSASSNPAIVWSLDQEEGIYFVVFGAGKLQLKSAWMFTGGPCSATEVLNVKYTIYQMPSGAVVEEYHPVVIPAGTTSGHTIVTDDTLIIRTANPGGYVRVTMSASFPSGKGFGAILLRGGASTGELRTYVNLEPTN